MAASDVFGDFRPGPSALSVPPGVRYPGRVNLIGEDPALPTRLIELPGRGVTRVWECDGPPGAPALMLIHGVAANAELNWSKVTPPLARHYRVVAADLRNHGDGIRAGARFRLEDCADDVAGLAAVLGIPAFTAVGYSMGGMIAQLLYQRHPSLVSGLVLCSTAGSLLVSPMEQLAALALPAAFTAMWWNPALQLMTAEVLGPGLLGPIPNPATAEWVHAQLSRTTFAGTVSAMRAACDFNSDGWIGQVTVPTAVVVTTRDRIAPASRQRELARAIPGVRVFEVDGDHAMCITAPRAFADVLLAACRSVQPSAAGGLGVDQRGDGRVAAHLV